MSSRRELEGVCGIGEETRFHDELAREECLHDVVGSFFFFIFVASFHSIYAASHANVELLASHREQSPILRATAFGASPEFIRRLVYMLLFFAVFFY